MIDEIHPPTDAGRLLVLFPGALGDFLCCWAALAALRAATGVDITLAARPAWFAVLPEGAARTLSIDRREIADLFASTPLSAGTIELLRGHARVESWTGHGDAEFARRLAAASGGVVRVHAFHGMRAGEHASAYYARCLAGPPPLTRLPIRPAAARWADDLWDAARLPPRTLVLHAGSGGARKIWLGVDDVAQAWRSRGGAVLWLVGPAESAAAHATGDLVVRGESLDRIAAVLQRADRYLGNDSGISHLAGLVGARGVAVFGPSDARIWHPLGGTLRVLSAPDACSRCGPERLCVHRVPVERVLAALD